MSSCLPVGGYNFNQSFERQRRSMPKHEKSLEIVTDQPYNAATPLPALQEGITPTGLTYVRNHFSVPALEAQSWGLRISGAIAHPQVFSLADIQAMPARTQVLTLECAGNGRIWMDPQPEGTPWDLGAVSVINVTGTSLSNVMKVAGIKPGVVELSFQGADSGEIPPGRLVNYMRSLPLEMALHPETMLVWAMNGEPLPPDHGFPVRLHVPGWYGMAAVKWLVGIEALTEPFEGYFQTEQYTYREEAGTPEAEPVREMRVRSLITFPQTGATLAMGPIEVEGIAWSGKGSVTTIEFSTDAGKVWKQVDVQYPQEKFAPANWTFNWVPEGYGKINLLSRASDSSGETQPLKHRWNRLGYGNNGVQSVEITIA
jgi:DMSO/TMAO reductase YedYZ molybdopterin-dependent catalytic subunit